MMERGHSCPQAFGGLFVRGQKCPRSVLKIILSDYLKLNLRNNRQSSGEVFG
jgi:hypothetical protein